MTRETVWQDGFMYTNPDLPNALREPELLRALRRTGETAARRQTQDRGIVEDAGIHALNALFEAVLRPDGPTEGAWRAYIRTTATRFAQDQDKRLKAIGHAGRAGSALRGGEGRGDSAFDEAGLRWHGVGTFTSDLANRLDAEHEIQVLEILDERSNRLLVAKYLDGKSTKQIASEEGMTPKGVERALYHAKKRLQQER
ncbi:sigma-70 family RNA polymerase sigma factor [Paeniglutamicibacter sp. MACA_103]|uniref:sigma-70 family RNA polymerase sigma factor n=1 Tax=Paeniglutamicibacter sp. MACA_103 TaxID=3377337 RepID=UPI003894814F